MLAKGSVHSIGSDTFQRVTVELQLVPEKRNARCQFLGWLKKIHRIVCKKNMRKWRFLAKIICFYGPSIPWLCNKLPEGVHWRIAPANRSETRVVSPRSPWKCQGGLNWNQAVTSGSPWSWKHRKKREVSRGRKTRHEMISCLKNC